MNSVICLPIMNCEKYLKNIFNNLLKLYRIFNKIIIIFGYDNSTDNSLNLLEEFKSNNKNLNIIIIKNTSKRFKYRTHNLEHIRNLMLKLVIDKYSDYDYYISMDSDDVCSIPINIEILEKHIKNNNNWDILTFNKDDYYDIWALQYDIFIHHFRCLQYNSWPVIFFIKDDITKKINNLKENEYFPVYSAFNGFGIYKMKYVLNSKYDGKTQYYFSKDKIDYMIKYLNKNVMNKRKLIKINDSNENCEHIGFHISIKNKYNNVKNMITKDKIF